MLYGRMRQRRGEQEKRKDRSGGVGGNGGSRSTRRLDEGLNLADWTDEEEGEEDYFERVKKKREEELRSNMRTLDRLVRSISLGEEGTRRRYSAMQPAPPAR